MNDEQSLADALVTERYSRRTAGWWKHDRADSPTRQAPPSAPFLFRDDDVTIARRRRELNADFNRVDGRKWRTA